MEFQRRHALGGLGAVAALGWLRWLCRNSRRFPPSTAAVVMATPSRESVSRVVVITGACGTLASTLITMLLEDTSVAIVAMDMLPDPVAFPNVERILYICGNSGCLEHMKVAILSGRSHFNAPVVSIFAVAAQLPFVSMSLEQLLAANTSQATAAVEAAAAESVPCMVFTSSASVVMRRDRLLIDGECGELWPYPDPGEFVDDYAASKCAAERIVLKANGRSLSNGGQLCTVSLRPSVIYGSNDKHLAQVRLQGRQNFVIGDPEEIVDFVWVDSVAWGHVLAFRSVLIRPELGGRCFHICHGAPVSKGQFWGKIGESGKTLWGLREPWAVPFAIVQALAWVNESLHFLFGMCFNSTMRRDCIQYMGGRSWWFSDAVAKTELGYAPLKSWEDSIVTMRQSVA
eukprot:CAMPEP_0204339218 /NCGR_PEP_ID=MMETSP0469-20131031/21637_1 /ASSEMBLY_ACC=CAM_ASM_000384 /TAXON_ID=2969 /ORGANISM="Oxyrrhis marina" /LENGTH=400 /DNA_ID=CAMNT_0051323539 /DNA_START=1 /DNA_END=1203 /DNA_ORIENTATION=+